MKVLRGSNVNTIWPEAVALLKIEGRRQGSRSGDVLVLDEPVVTEYLEPTKRVLFCHIRNANPFFHLMEAIWMLGGFRKATWLDQFVSDFSSRFAEDDGLQHGAYGYRWRNQWHFDQLKVIIDRLKRDPNDRRVVLSMWDPEFDLIDPRDPGPEPKDLPCNTQVYFRVVEGALDMTVTCRSNDIVWGCYGANAVHFSILHEFMASMIGVSVGIYRQFSNNWHGYVNTLPQKVVLQFDGEYPETSPLVRDKKTFLSEVDDFVRDPGKDYSYTNEFFRLTARPMFLASQLWREKKQDEALKMIDGVLALDWKLAGREWMLRKMGKN